MMIEEEAFGLWSDVFRLRLAGFIRYVFPRDSASLVPPAA